ncbi:F-box/kelch-repeat protein KIB1-like [Cicer arietinum]|uniref:Uncharacterized protein LOC101491070 n=1 Tax=Cicer arietinum TaxID=3827 RepID=A0A1S2YMX9_CICAR|nr:uncharacterized protein LOC101491070 [Cicer arietinum]
MASLSTLPYAVIPSLIDDTNMDDNNNTITPHRTIKHYEWNNIFDGHVGSWCVGSSHNFFILLDNIGCPLLLNPFTNTSINVPPFHNAFIRRAKVPSFSYYVEHLKENFVSKAVLKSSPSPSQHTLAIMFSYPRKIAFFNHNGAWVELIDAKRNYCDIVFDNNILYALAGDGSIEGWNFSRSVPRKILDVNHPAINIDKEEEKEFSSDKFSTQLYLVVSKGEFFMVERFIGNFVNANGEVVYEGYNLSYGEICPYRTKHFNVYKLDFQKKSWEKIKCLDGQVLFVGANESTLVDASRFDDGNLIYFSDDRWEEMNLDYSYGGHDWGVFNLQDESVKFFAPDVNKMDPPPIWMVPTNFSSDSNNNFTNEITSSM